MGYLAVTAGFFALGAYLGRHLSYGWALVWFIAPCLPDLHPVRSAAIRGAERRPALRGQPAARIGDGAHPRVLREREPAGLWQAGAATALFIGGFGAAGYATRQDLSGTARLCFWALIALIMFGIVMIFIHIPGGSLPYAVLGLVILAGLTMFDFQRLRRLTDLDSAPLIAASIFRALNVLLFFLRIFSRNKK